MANSLGWADSAVAATYSRSLLFLRTPLLQAVGAFRRWSSAEVAFNKLKIACTWPSTNRRSSSPPAVPGRRWSCVTVFHYADKEQQPVSPSAA